MKDSATVFTVTPESTERFCFTAAGNFLVFTRDVISASAEFIVVSPAIPYDPSTKVDLAYHFNSMWNTVQPSVAFQVISRMGETFTFFDADVEAQLSHSVGLTVRIENILGGASDFWPGYPEKPRSIWATVRYLF